MKNRNKSDDLQMPVFWVLFLVKDYDNLIYLGVLQSGNAAYNASIIFVVNDYPGHFVFVGLRRQRCIASRSCLYPLGQITLL